MSYFGSCRANLEARSTLIGSSVIGNSVSISLIGLELFLWESNSDEFVSELVLRSSLAEGALVGKLSIVVILPECGTHKTYILNGRDYISQWSSSLKPTDLFIHVVNLTCCFLT